MMYGVGENALQFLILTYDDEDELPQTMMVNVIRKVQ